MSLLSFCSEPGFESMRGTAQGNMICRAYNRNLLHATLLYACEWQLTTPPRAFADAIRSHFTHRKTSLIALIERERAIRTELDANYRRKLVVAATAAPPASGGGKKRKALVAPPVAPVSLTYDSDEFVSAQDLHETGNIRRMKFEATATSLLAKLAGLSS